MTPEDLLVLQRLLERWGADGINAALWKLQHDPPPPETRGRREADADRG